MSSLGALAVIGLEVFRWWAVVEAVALAALPLADWLLGRLPSRGYALAKALGLMVVGYALWLGATFGVLGNAEVTVALLVAGLALLSWLKVAPGRPPLSELWQQRRGLVLTVEALFFLAFLAWAIFRAYDPDIVGTEKPMEFAFLNALLRSDRFPPPDPWLSGYSISYYYFGYLIVAALTHLTGSLPGAAFNLSLALLFALTAASAFGLGYDLVAAAGPRLGEIRERGAILAGLAASYLLVILSNLEVLVEMLTSQGLLSEQTWRWVHIKDLPPPSVAGVASWLPTDWMWWFRASRVIGQFDPASGHSVDYTINEFPFFSFLLGDLHPHVLALPFVLLALGLALSLLLSDEPLGWSWLHLRPQRLVSFGLVMGGLAFINSWDLPTYLFILVAAVAVQRYIALREPIERWLTEVGGFAGAILLTSLLLYFPFYLGFRSQTSGVGIVEVRTKLHQFIIFWAPLLFLAASGAIWQISRCRVRLAGPTWFGLVAFLVVMALAGAFWAPTLVLVVFILALVILALCWSVKEVSGSTAAQGAALSETRSMGDAAVAYLGRERVKPNLFLLLLIGTGLLLLAGCEMLYVRDLFGNRMNTVFKFYYQAWVLLSLAGGYVLYYLALRLGPSAKGLAVAFRGAAWETMAMLLIVAGSVYPLTAAAARVSLADVPVLDGTVHPREHAEADYAAMAWLRESAPKGAVVLEAAGGSYTTFARVSAFTGLPTVVGWDFHEIQWRGTSDEAMRRKADVETIYSTTDLETAQALMERYGVKYVYVGPLEQQTYGKYGRVAMEKFATFMDLAYSNHSVKVYRVREPAWAAR
mgnify:CR=1 FL=1